MLSVREICTSFQEIFADVAIKDGRRQACQGDDKLGEKLLYLILTREGSV
jgi:hypothetical protein